MQKRRRALISGFIIISIILIAGCSTPADKKLVSLMARLPYEPQYPIYREIEEHLERHPSLYRINALLSTDDREMLCIALRLLRKHKYTEPVTFLIDLLMHKDRIVSANASYTLIAIGRDTEEVKERVIERFRQLMKVSSSPKELQWCTLYIHTPKIECERGNT